MNNCPRCAGLLATGYDDEIRQEYAYCLNCGCRPVQEAAMIRTKCAWISCDVVLPADTVPGEYCPKCQEIAGLYREKNLSAIERRLERKARKREAVQRYRAKKKKQQEEAA